MFVSSLINSRTSRKNASNEGNTIKNKNPHFDSNNCNIHPTVPITISLFDVPITSSLTIGGKAICKSIAIKNSTSIVFGFSKIVSLFYYPKK